VPPKTIIAAVGCRIWEILPPSSSNPPMIPISPSSTPLTLPLSTPAILRLGGRRRVRGAGHEVPRAHAGKQSAPEFNHADDDLVHWFLNEIFFSIEQRDDGVRTLLDILDQVGTNHRRSAHAHFSWIHPSPATAGTRSSPTSVIAGEGRNISPQRYRDTEFFCGYLCDSMSL
jgi:hypothetical protein